MKADEIKHIQKQPVITNLTDEVIANSNFFHTDDEAKDKDGQAFSKKGNVYYDIREIVLSGP